MRRLIIHSIVALFTFAVGLLAYNLYDYLYIVLPSALILWIIAKRISRMNLTLHCLKVALITSILSSVLIYIFFVYFMPRSPLSDCVPDVSEYEMSR